MTVLAKSSVKNDQKMCLGRKQVSGGTTVSCVKEQ